jgi:SAM-dependent methyltransferase
MILGGTRMQGYDAGTYGKVYADVYDDWYHSLTDTDSCVDGLADLAGAGPVLDLGAGTGRIAIPLAARGLRVTAVEISPEMIGKLKEKPGSDKVDVQVGDMTDFDGGGEEYSLIFIAANTLMSVADLDAQVATIGNAARQLAPGGRFVVEGLLVDPSMFDRVRSTVVETGEAGVIVSKHDRIRQVVERQLVLFTPEGNQLYPTVTRYFTLAELDLMGRLAGLEVEATWADWRRTPHSQPTGWYVRVFRTPE